MTTTQGLQPFDYTSRDYASVKADLIDRIPSLLPEWTSRSPSDFGMVLIDLFAYSVDKVNYYGDRIANEAFLATATQRRSVLAIAQMLDYTPHGPTAASVTMQFTIDAGAGSTLIPAGTQVSTVGTSTQEPIVFETAEDVTIAAGDTDTVGATQGETVTDEAVATSDGSVDQSYPLFQTPVIDDSVTVYVDEGAGEVLWTQLAHLIDATNNQKAYSLYSDEDGVVHVVFGDGANGKIPALGADITATYRVGGGSSGNVGTGTITLAVGTLSGVTVITNTGAATGGADPETLDEIRIAAPQSIKAIDRAVTLADYATLAKAITGVALAKAVGTSSTAVTVYVAPVGGGAPTTGLKNLVAAYLAEKKMFSTTITMADPTYTGIDISMNLVVLSQYNRTAVSLAVEDALNALLDMSANEFGQYIALSDVYNAVLAVEGVDRVTITILCTTAAATLGDVDLGDNVIPEPGTYSVTATGGLTGT